MNQINLSSIKRESVNNIFRAIADKDKISRAEITAKTGLSLMTVGKVVDALLERGAIIQVKENKAVAGRKAGLVHLNPALVCIVLDMTTRNFTMTVIDVTLHVVDKMEYEYNEDFYFEENIYLFIKNVKIFALRTLDMKNCVGIGVSVPGSYDEQFDTVENCRMPELRPIHLKSVIRDILSEEVSLIEQDTLCAAVSNVYSVENFMEKNVAYIALDGFISSAVLFHGKMMFGRAGGDIGNMLVRNGKRLSDVIRAEGINDDSIQDFVMALYNLSLCVAPDTIVIENRLAGIPGDFEDKLHARLDGLFVDSLAAPKVLISHTEIPHAHRGLCLEMRRRWLENEILR